MQLCACAIGGPCVAGAPALAHTANAIAALANSRVLHPLAIVHLIVGRTIAWASAFTVGRPFGPQRIVGSSSLAERAARGPGELREVRVEVGSQPIGRTIGPMVGGAETSRGDSPADVTEPCAQPDGRRLDQSRSQRATLRAQRKPTKLFREAGASLSRYDALPPPAWKVLQPPPRTTRALPLTGPVGSTTAPVE